MKVLWICNLILPEIAADMGASSIPKEGWVKGLLDALLDMKETSDKLQLSLAFPVSKELAGKDGILNGTVKLQEHAGYELSYYGFYEDTVHESVYDQSLENRLSRLIGLAEPDIVHCFGTEFPHTLAAAKVWNNPDRLLIGIQGPCTVYAQRYTSQLPEEIVNRHTFRDALKKDSILEQQQKYEKRGEHERAAVLLSGHIAGRTQFDKELAGEWNPNAKYHHAGETLRKCFYSGGWTRETAEKYRIFVSQADYPLKGFHYLLTAVGEILNAEEVAENIQTSDKADIQIYVAGQSVMGYESIKQKIKISSYGKYLRSLLEKYGLEDRVHVLGRLSAEEMKEQYLKCGMYVCCSASENSPNSLGEAMMLQVPIVAAEVGGIPTVFTVGEDGYSYRNELEDSLDTVTDNLKNALLECWNAWDETDLVSANEVDRRRHNAGFHARQNHDPERNAMEMYGIYIDMMK